MPFPKIGRFAFGLPVVAALAAAVTVSAVTNPAWRMRRIPSRSSW